MTAVERLVKFCSALGIELRLTFNSLNSQFEICIDSGTTHVRGCGSTLETAAKSALIDLRKTIKLVEDTP